MLERVCQKYDVLKDMPMRLKLGLLCAVGLTGMLLIGNNLLDHQRDQIAFVQQERQGLDQLDEVLRVTNDLLPTYRTQLRAAAMANPEAVASLRQLQTEIDQLMQTVAKDNASLGERFGTAPQVKAWLDEWQNLKASSSQAEPAAIYARATAFAGHGQALVKAIADKSGLSLDPQADSYALMYVLVNVVPAAMDDVGHLAVLTPLKFSYQLNAEETGWVLGALPQLAAVQNELRRGIGMAEASATVEIVPLKSKVQLADQALATLIQGAARQLYEAKPTAGLATHVDAAYQALDIVHDEGFDMLSGMLLAREQQLIAQRHVQIIEIAVCALIMLLFSVYVSTILGAHMRRVIEVFRAISAEDYSSRMPAAGRDEIGQVFAALKNMQGTLQASRQTLQEQMRTTARIKQALDVCDTSVMLADKDLNIIYLNHAALSLMQARAPAIRSDLPRFDADQLLGSSVDVFHKQPEHQRAMMARLQQVHKTDINIGGLTFGLVATPLFADDGERLGTVVEWDDKTERLAKAEQEKHIADANARIKQALDVCDTSVMLADKDLNIIYMNNAASEMMRSRAAEIRSELPRFDADRLVGASVDIFHKHPQHQREMLARLQQSHKADIQIGGLTFGLVATPLFAANGERLGTVVEWDDKTERLAQQLEEKRVSDANARIKQALDSVSTSAMIADVDGNIIYMNHSVGEMLRRVESDLRSVLPHFNVDKVLGANFDIFHRNPAHQRNLLGALKGVYKTQIEVAGKTFALIANPVFNAQGERLGSVVEWADRTAEVAIEREVDLLVDAAAAGDFSRQLSLEGKVGFFLSLAQGLNKLVGVTEQGIADVLRVLGAMARGDLSERIQRDYQGAFAQLKADANGTAEKLTQIINEINLAVTTITTGANEIAQGNADLSQRTEEQASSLEETASSMEEMTSIVRQSAAAAKQANTLAQDASRRAEQGGEVVSRAVGAMQAINNSSKKIADIIGVIDEIAFQTNLLALNAAVEAARAGEQGRGFAVVAGEVRNLAQRSGDAAKQIKTLIQDSVGKVEDGSLLVNESGATLREIVESIRQVSEMVNGIASSAAEQTLGIDQVSQAVTQMDSVTQQNAALVEQASAASEAMADQAANLAALVRFFKVDGSGARASLPGTAVRPVRPAMRTVQTSASRPAVRANADEWEDF